MMQMALLYLRQHGYDEAEFSSTDDEFYEEEPEEYLQRQKREGLLDEEGYKEAKERLQHIGIAEN